MLCLQQHRFDTRHTTIALTYASTHPPLFTNTYHRRSFNRKQSLVHDDDDDDDDTQLMTTMT